MNKNQKTKEKICTFYASDYHFEMITLPYINKNMEENKEVIVLTENDLEDTIKTLISKMNLKEEKKNRILNINWSNDDLNKFKSINNNINKQKEMVIFIKGKENYIRNVNKNIEKWIEKSNSIKVVDCYDMEEISEKMDNIIGKYKKILNTKGEKRLIF